MKIYEVIDDLLSHKIGREQAIKSLIDIFKDTRNNTIKFEVNSKGCTVKNEHAVLELITQYNYKALEQLKEGDKVELYVLPY